MEEVMPQLFAELVNVRQKLEKHYRDMQDIEFTVESGKLYMLQTRSGKRTAAAALKIAVDMVERRADRPEGGDPAHRSGLARSAAAPDARSQGAAQGDRHGPAGLAGRGQRPGRLHADEAEDARPRASKVILVRLETSPEDIHGMHAAEGILTARGGMTSHAAVVARGMGRPCVSGAGDLRIDAATPHDDGARRHGQRRRFHHPRRRHGRSDPGEVPTIQPELSGDFAKLMGWADRSRRLEVRTNAETPADARTARDFGAEGIGLCRTEHMFFDGDRIVAMREMILADDEAGRRKALAQDPADAARRISSSCSEIMAGLPVTIRLLDPPLHEFLPHTDAEMAEVAAAAGIDRRSHRAHRAAMLHESNPMLGHRGCRLGITYPEIYEMQVRAIFEAAARSTKETGETVEPEIMIPLVAMRQGARRS